MLLLLAHIFKTWSLHSQICLWMNVANTIHSNWREYFPCCFVFGAVLLCPRACLAYSQLFCSLGQAQQNDETTYNAEVGSFTNAHTRRQVFFVCFFFWQLAVDVYVWVSKMVEIHLHLPSVSTTFLMEKVIVPKSSNSKVFSTFQVGKLIFSATFFWRVFIEQLTAELQVSVMWPLWLGTLKGGRCIAPGGGWKWWIFYWNFHEETNQGSREWPLILRCIIHDCLLVVLWVSTFSGKNAKNNRNTQGITKIASNYSLFSIPTNRHPKVFSQGQGQCLQWSLVSSNWRDGLRSSTCLATWAVGFWYLVMKESPKMKELWRNQVQPMFNMFVQKISQDEAKCSRLRFECKILTFNTSWNWFFPKPDSHLRRYQSRIRVATYFLLANYFSKLPRSPIVVAHAIWK